MSLGDSFEPVSEGKVRLRVGCGTDDVETLSIS
jgi:hypothetical protein